MTATGITAPQGFSASATTAGIKPSGKPDMALVVNTGPEYTAAAVFTTNRIVAAPVVLTRAAVADHALKAVVYNAGNANACNGAKGHADAAAVVAAAAKKLGVASDDVAMCSTGIIGEPLPTDKLLAAIDPLVEGLGGHGTAAAEAIMTTDTVSKQTHIAADGFTVGGMAKGVGMMAPSLATMLVCLTTDASLTPEVADAALVRAVNTTFNRIDVDGCTSTNDTVVLMASGASGVTPDVEEFSAALTAACEDLARQLQADAEGVTKRVVVTVTGAKNNNEALDAARTVARDNLFKCAMFGSDPNWGRVLAAVGMARADMDPDNISVFFNDQPVCVDSCGVEGARDVDLSGEDIAVRIDLGLGGPGSDSVYTTDLSHSYVEINSAYTT